VHQWHDVVSVIALVNLSARHTRERITHEHGLPPLPVSDRAIAAIVGVRPGLADDRTVKPGRPVRWYACWHAFSLWRGATRLQPSLAAVAHLGADSPFAQERTGYWPMPFSQSPHQSNSLVVGKRDCCNVPIITSVGA
jgi:hypothetical protein